MTKALKVSVLVKGQELLSRTFVGDRIVIGRDAACDLRLRNANVSKQHACIIRGESLGYVLCDLVSKNGVFDGVDRIAACPIHDGGSARIGQFDLHFRLLDVPWEKNGEPEGPEGARDDDATMLTDAPPRLPKCARNAAVPGRATNASSRTRSESALALWKLRLPGH